MLTLRLSTAEYLTIARPALAFGCTSEVIYKIITTSDALLATIDLILHSSN
jgi:hypothetical protein